VPYSLRLHFRAARLTRQGDHVGAAECYRKMAADGPEQWPLGLMVADSLERAGRLDEAVAEIQRVVEGQPDDFLTLKTASRLLINSGDHVTGRRYVEKALQALVAGPPTRTDRFFSALAVASVHVIRLLPRYRRVHQPRLKDFDPRHTAEEWRRWAREYLAWHDARFPKGANSGASEPEAIQQGVEADEAR
jgi:hypothetical protein